MNKVYITEIKTKGESDFKMLSNKFYATLEDARNSIVKDGVDCKRIEAEPFENHLEFYTTMNGLFIHRISELTLA